MIGRPLDAPLSEGATRDGRAPVGTVVLSLEGIGVRLGGRQILSDVSFELHAGEVTGLIGSNGAGKTTLLKVILGLQPATSGEVRIGPSSPVGPLDGRPSHSRRGARPTRGQRGIGYVPQTVLLDADAPLRARDLVALGLDGQRLGLPLPSRERREQVDRMLGAVGAGSFADSRVGNLSGGERQRVLIAHALIGRPRILLLDEPLANLDLRSEQEVVHLLGQLAREQGLAVLLSAHEINPLLAVMQRVVYVANGRAASGTTEEVVRPEVLSKLYGHHVDVLRVHGRVVVIASPSIDPAVTEPFEEAVGPAWREGEP